MKQAKIEDLLLLRVWQAGKKGITLNEVRKAMDGLLPFELNSEMLKSSFDGLANAGLFLSSAKKGARYRITPAGSERARGLVRTSKGKWPNFLVGYCLDLSSVTKDAIRVALLRELCAIPEGAKVPKALDMFLLHHLAQSGTKTIEKAVIRRALGVSVQRDKPQTELRPQATDLNHFAKVVMEAAGRIRDGWVGNKVFISRVWKEILNQGGLEGTSFDAFKSRLIQANRERLISLSRADLAPFMDREDVLASEIRHMDATFHFLDMDSQEARS